MNRINLAILAAVDAGKTTLSESMLYLSGAIRKAGRVDHGDAFLDSHELERRRGITIFSKMARMECGGLGLTLLDTPGHVDFTAETERTLTVADMALLLVSAADGVTGHTVELWNLLKRYHLPTVIFINKMDQAGADADRVMADLCQNLDDRCVRFDYWKRTDQGDAGKVSGEDKDLEALFFMSGRALRRCIHQLRSEEIPICSSKNGYYYAKNQAEIKRSAESLGQFSDSVSSTRMNLLSSRAPKPVGKCVIVIFPYVEM